MLYIAAGPMKTASTYLYQVMSEIALLHGGRAPKPYGIDEGMVLGWEMEPTPVVIKLHEFHAALKGAGYTAVVSIRDPRDVFVSLMHFQQNTFEGTMASRAVQNWPVAVASWQDLQVAYIRYEDMMKHPSRTVARIGQEMGYNLHPDLAEYIARKWSIPANKMRAEMKLDTNQRHFMSARHIYSGKIGQWKVDLTPEQLAIVEEHFRNEIKRFGY